MVILTLILDINKFKRMIIKAYHYIFYCYYNLINKNADHKEDGASSLTTVLISSIIISIYYTLNIIVERRVFIPAMEGFGIFFMGLLIWYLDRVYFIKRKNYVVALNEFDKTPKYVSIFIGVLLLIIPFSLFVFTGIKMGNYIRSIH